MPHTILVPDIGDFKDVEVIDVLVKPGDTVALETPLATLETEKATMDVPSTIAGVVKRVAIKKGDRVSKGAVVVEVEASEAAKKVETPTKFETRDAGRETRADAAKNPSPQPSVTAPGVTLPSASVQSSPGTGRGSSAPLPVRGEVARSAGEGSPTRSAVLPVASSQLPVASASHASPSVRKFARELGADLSRIKGSGPKNRITHEDVKAWVKGVLASGPAAHSLQPAAFPKIPEVDFAKFGAVEVKPLSRIQKISGPRLHASWVNVPHVWQMDQADITELEDARTKLKGKAAKEGIKLTPLAFIMRACVKALQEFPTVNASLDAAGQNLVFKKYVHLGFAADTPNGLMVPVVRDAQRKDVYELARDLAALSEKARDGKLTAADMQGGSFTISSLGGIGGTSFTPIINAPEVAILGVAKSSMQPVYQDGKFVPRLILPFTLAYDHRVIDGAMAVRFTTFLAQRLADVKALLEAVP
jgi:pyruvate dehydrogenase E2 component (dihydrolipoamide acetyltransferase)